MFYDHIEYTQDRKRASLRELKLEMILNLLFARKALKEDMLQLHAEMCYKNAILKEIISTR